jgi:predicted secreted protein
MITPLLVSLSLLAPATVEPVPPAPAPATRAQDPDPEYAQRLADAGEDTGKLWDLAEWCKERDLREERKSTLLKIIEIDGDHEQARKALGHRQYDGKWFESYSALSKYRREEEKRMEEQGLVRFNDGWAPAADVPFLRMGWEKDPSGNWTHPAELARRQEDARLSSEGWTRQGMTWVSPEDQAKVDEGLWKCGEDWLPLEEANEYHSQLLQWWESPGEHFVLLATVPRAADGTGAVAWATWWADQCWEDLARATGVQPTQPPSVLVLNSLQQYNTFAAGDQGQQIPPSEITGASSVHFAFLADALFDPRVQPPMWRGMGVCFWDRADEAMAVWGQYAVRHAAALSYLEAVDPSWETISNAVANPGNMQVAAFWNEKKLPRWLHYGIASYCERYAKDPQAGEGGDPWAFRAWAIQNLRAGGELQPLEQIFSMNLDPNDPAGSVRRIHEAGLLVSFVLDGGCEPVSAAHEALKQALAAGEDTAEQVQALQQALADHLDELKAYAKF